MIIPQSALSNDNGVAPGGSDAAIRGGAGGTPLERADWMHDPGRDTDQGTPARRNTATRGSELSTAPSSTCSNITTTGALGVVINRPTPEQLAEPLDRWVDLQSSPIGVFSGGPVEPDALIALAYTRQPIAERPTSTCRRSPARVVVSRPDRRSGARRRRRRSGASLPRIRRLGSRPARGRDRGGRLARARLRAGRRVRSRAGGAVAHRATPPGWAPRLARRGPRRPQRELTENSQPSASDGPSLHLKQTEPGWPSQPSASDGP